MISIPPYLDKLSDWKNSVSESLLLFDADPIITIQEMNALDLLTEFDKLQVTKATIHPVRIELMRTDNIAKKTVRQTILSSLKDIKLNEKVYEKSVEMQFKLSELKCSPSPTDVYLAGTLAWYSQMKIYNMRLLTSNLKDFPEPIFKRESGIIVQNERSIKVISVLSYGG